MSHKKKTFEFSIEIVKQVIIAHQKLFVDIYLTDSPEIEAILHQMIHGKPHHKSIKLYQYLVEAFLFSGGGNQSNHGYYAKQNHKPTFNRVKQAVKAAQCPKLATFGTFKGCGYRKTTKKCNEPAFLGTCPLPTFDMKRGNLNHMAFSLYFFLRDVCGRDFYTFARQHFGDHLPADGAITDLLQSFIEKITTIANVGTKLAHMALSALFLCRYPGWDYRRVGAHMIAVDSLVHNFLHRTGILDSYQLDHPYGPRCHAQNGCLGVIQDLASRIDCRKFNPTLPASFPRFIQYYEIEDAFPWPDFFPFRDVHHDNSLKGWTNRLLETNPVPAVWICNRLDGIDPAHIRRFDLVVEVPLPPLRTREKMLTTRLGGLKVSADCSRELAANVHLAPAHIDKAAKVADYCQPRNPAATGKILKTVIGNVHKALNLTQRQGVGQPLDPSYSLAHVNADHDLEGVVKCCRRSPAVRLLLFGPPGSGKTAFVQYLGHVLGKSVLLKTGSDLLRPYVGQTEQKIAAMFREAENQAAILFVDEVDGFFQSRGRAHHSWEVTIVNEFLGELERFAGTFAGATNLKLSLDLAVFRRFDFKVGFDYLKPEQAWLLLKAMAAGLKVPVPLSEVCQLKARLAYLHHLTPGDFAVIKRKSLLYERKPAADVLLTWLEQEVSSKPDLQKGLVGF